jgi:hypothetical protein
MLSQDDPQGGAECLLLGADGDALAVGGHALSLAPA